MLYRIRAWVHSALDWGGFIVFRFIFVKPLVRPLVKLGLGLSRDRLTDHLCLWVVPNPGWGALDFRARDRKPSVVASYGKVHPCLDSQDDQYRCPFSPWRSGLICHRVPPFLSSVPSMFGRIAMLGCLFECHNAG